MSISLWIYALVMPSSTIFLSVRRDQRIVSETCQASMINGDAGPSKANFGSDHCCASNKSKDVDC
jgi:hypothetical protein